MEHDTESGQRLSTGHDMPGDTNPPGSVLDHGIAEPAESAESAEPAEPAEPTGDPRVDEALRGLSRLGDVPVTEHPQVFESIHGALAEVLGELRPGAGPADEPRAGN
jgi:hypothetical protein